MMIAWQGIALAGYRCLILLAGGSAAVALLASLSSARRRGRAGVWIALSVALSVGGVLATLHMEDPTRIDLSTKELGLRVLLSALAVALCADASPRGYRPLSLTAAAGFEPMSRRHRTRINRA